MSRLDIEVMQSVQKALGERVRELRTKNGWPSPEGFAEACRITPDRLLQVERGETDLADLTLSMVAVIAENLKTTISGLFEEIM
jgi:transcriptional regulator with XRE-family HTH domain